MRAELGAFAGIEPALEQRTENRRVDLRPVEVRRRQHHLDFGRLQRQRGAVVEQPAVEPGDRLEADPAAGGHHLEEGAGEIGEVLRDAPRLSQHAREHVIGQQPHVVGEHAEDEPVDEVRDRLRIVAALPQRLRDHGEGRRRALGKRLPGFVRPKLIGIRERPLEHVARRRVGEVVQAEFIGLADTVRPVGADAEPHHVRDDQQRWVLQRQRVLPELSERGVEVSTPALVFPGEVVAFPDVGPALAARVLARAALETIGLAGWVGFSRRRLIQQPAEVDEVLLRTGTLLQRRGAPLGNELVCGQGVVR